ncbi:unnamed protein product [Closterium sp. Naga37s-1]|nr:unnamed protein product [Closterium sp. Naga37s-1]
MSAILADAESRGSDPAVGESGLSQALLGSGVFKVRDAVAGPLARHVQRIEARLDPKLFTPPNNAVTLWDADRDGILRPDASTVEMQREGTSESLVDLRVELKQGEEVYSVEERLRAVVGMSVATRLQVLEGLWNHIKANKLQDPSDPSSFTCDATLQALFKQDKLKISSLPIHISPFLSPPPPLTITHRISLATSPADSATLPSLDPPFHPLGPPTNLPSYETLPPVSADTCVDVTVTEAPALAAETARAIAAMGQQPEIDAIDAAMARDAELLAKHRRRRAFFLAFSHSPGEFIRDLMVSQQRDLDQMQQGGVEGAGGAQAFGPETADQDAEFYALPCPVIASHSILLALKSPLIPLNPTRPYFTPFSPSDQHVSPPSHPYFIPFALSFRILLPRKPPSPHHHFRFSLAPTHYPLFSPTCPPLLPLIPPLFALSLPTCLSLLPPFLPPIYPPSTPPPPPPPPPSPTQVPPLLALISPFHPSPLYSLSFPPFSPSFPPLLHLNSPVSPSQPHPPPLLPSFSPLLPLFHPPDPLHTAPCSFSLPPILPLIFSPSPPHVPHFSGKFPPLLLSLPISAPPHFPLSPPRFPPFSHSFQPLHRLKFPPPNSQIPLFSLSTPPPPPPHPPPPSSLYRFPASPPHLRANTARPWSITSADGDTAEKAVQGCLEKYAGKFQGGKDRMAGRPDALVGGQPAAIRGLVYAFPIEHWSDEETLRRDTTVFRQGGARRGAAYAELKQKAGEANITAATPTVRDVSEEEEEQHDVVIEIDDEVPVQVGDVQVEIDLEMGGGSGQPTATSGKEDGHTHEV